ncbi:acyltransferase-like protein [Marinilabilia salmonicolor]|jgi:1-acyl-sn-glycerol-3-phosphate acyltransferase|uniref:lysophospholipid acyltransferase family protein n=1 Tax=Marinilabilia salmonicolor TaxID=989 RepID=UPI000D07585A|nr:lysophospholipid acyltransferase family protein [Marinilabilia salmonicolor]PRY91940.1 acyltransferase-like protein [Marinilabilia salmonicolor]
MIKASHHPVYIWFFRHFTNFLVRLKFKKIFIEGDTAADNSPLLVINNHFSWWDGFFINYLNNKLWKKKFHVMMLEEELEKRRFLARGGAFSIRRNHSSTPASFIYAKKILENSSNNLLLMYPQGKLQAQATRYLEFEPGVERLLQKTNPTVKMVVTLIDYFGNPKPSLWLYIKNLNSDGTIPTEKAFNDFMNECIDHHNKNTDL